MSEDALNKARELIENGQYDEARLLLATIGHPLARRMQAELEAAEARETRFTAAEDDVVEGDFTEE